MAVTYKNDEMHVENEWDLEQELVRYSCISVKELRTLLAKYNITLVLDYENNAENGTKKNS